MVSLWHFVGGSVLVLFGHLYLLVPLSGDASVPVAIGFLALYAALVLTGAVEIAVAFGRTRFADRRREMGGVGCIMFGIAAAPLAIMDLLDSGTSLSEAALWVSIAVVMPAMGVYYLRGGGSFGEPSPN
ncbi:hypothetical protein [Natronorubrum daqingense]|uniref:Uncharacterized protein n=1 Tax=Natronorubrum daqingense TaxID=588898 RepID=A0A1N6ZNC0_9EURY|nr:hypothetical protein [Natronorubrum daqingense]APX95299.1 hypothetical protein BB347_01010 [Natronorubrum daqingense]SIR28370.1 hypothetical protein SAMN05421809_0860 [Natronorubrum daqingense]